MKKNKDKNKDKKQQFVVIGLGSFGTAVAETLASLDKEVLAIDLKEDLVQDIAETVTYAVQADARDEEVLERLGVQNFDVGIVAIGNNMEASIMTTLLLKELGVKYIIAKAMTHTQEKALYKLGADKVVLPEEAMGQRIAHQIATTNLIDYIALSEKYSIFEFKCPHKWVGKTILELNVRQKYGVIILGMNRDDDFHVLIEGEEVFRENDVVILLGNKEVFRNNLEKR